MEFPAVLTLRMSALHLDDDARARAEIHNVVNLFSVQNTPYDELCGHYNWVSTFI